MRAREASAFVTSTLAIRIVCSMTRTEAARTLGVSRARLAALEREGSAHPERDDRGAPRYDEVEVERLRELIGTQPQTRRPKRVQKQLSGTPPPDQRSPRALELAAAVDEAETEARLVEAKRRLDKATGEAEQRERDRAELEARRTADAAAQQRAAWRTARIAAILVAQRDALAEAGWDLASVAGALSLAEALLNGFADAVLAGAAYPSWCASLLIAAALGVRVPDAPMVAIVQQSSYGPVEVWRSIQPGD